MKNKRLLYLILPVIILILEILPYGAVCNFANPNGEPWRRTYSYFSFIPFGYANSAPLLTAMMTCIVTALLIVYCYKGKESIAMITQVVLCIAVILSLCPLFIGTNYFSIVGALITFSLAVELFILVFTFKKTSE